MGATYLPKLFKKTSTGAIQEWLIGVDGTTIITTFGQVGGKHQTVKDSIKSGKSLGRKGATAPAEQAEKEAKAKWTKQKKAGYVESIGAAKAGATDSLIKGGVLPMLAKVYEEHLSKIAYPVAIQPKLDGHRCIAVIGVDGNVSLWTRTRKRITSVPHIENRLREIAKKIALPGSTTVLDGELYSHNLKDDFEKITSAVRKQEPSIESAEVQYHVYDMISPECFKTRIGRLANIVLFGGTIVELVNTKFASCEKEAEMYFTLFKKMGYEGSMVRLLNMGYEQKRSHQLLKVKTFDDAEFRITGMEEGRGKLQGHAGAFVCITNGKEFRVKMSGETSKLKEYWENQRKYIGDMLTVQFQGKTADGLPRFPVGIRIRKDL